MKQLISAITLSLCVSSAMAATNHDELKKELEIMTSVMNTSFKQSESRSPIRIRSTETTYLAKQGVVFSFATTGHNREFFIDLQGLQSVISSVPLPPEVIPPNIVVSANDDVDFEFYWNEASESDREQFQDAMEDAADELRELRSRERDVSWENRELERELRDLEFTLRNLSGEDREEVEQELERVRKKQVQLKEQKEQVQSIVVQIEKEQKQRVEERVAVQEKATKAFLSDFEDQIGSILCRFGSGLRALDENENVTFVLQDVKTVGKNRLDRIYVFSKKEINRCVQSKTDQESLLAAATVYEF